MSAWIFTQSAPGDALRPCAGRRGGTPGPLCSGGPRRHARGPPPEPRPPRGQDDPGSLAGRRPTPLPRPPSQGTGATAKAQGTGLAFANAAPPQADRVSRASSDAYFLNTPRPAPGYALRSPRFGQAGPSFWACWEGPAWRPPRAAAASASAPRPLSVPSAPPRTRLAHWCRYRALPATRQVGSMPFSRTGSKRRMSLHARSRIGFSHPVRYVRADRAAPPARPTALHAPQRLRAWIGPVRRLPPSRDAAYALRECRRPRFTPGGSAGARPGCFGRVQQPGPCWRREPPPPGRPGRAVRSARSLPLVAANPMPRRLGYRPAAET